MILDIHLHSFFSDGINSPLEMAQQVKKLKLSGFALTDHDTVKGHRAAREAARKLKLKFIPGIEVTSTDGHVVGLFIEEEIPKLSAAEVVDKIHERGGIAIAAHPYDHFRPGVKDLVKAVKFDYIETYNTRTLFFPDNWKAEKIANEFNLKGVVGSDAHSTDEVGFGTVQVRTLDDILKGKIKTKDARWTGPVLITYGKIRRLLKKHGFA